MGLLSVIEQNPGTDWKDASQPIRLSIDRSIPKRTSGSGRRTAAGHDAVESPMTTWPPSNSRAVTAWLKKPLPLRFNRLHASLQGALYRMRWTKLRQIQVDAIHEVFDGTGDLIIAAGRRRGKPKRPSCPSCPACSKNRPRESERFTSGRSRR